MLIGNIKPILMEKDTGCTSFEEHPQIFKKNTLPPILTIPYLPNLQVRSAD